MPKGHPKKGKPSTADWSSQNRVNSRNSPWRQAGRTGSARQRECVAYFDQLNAQGDTARKPRPELDVD